MSNTLMKVVQTVPAGDKETIYRLMYEVLCEIDTVYSTILYYDINKNEYIIQYNLSQTERYNTISTYDVVTKVADMVVNHDKKKRVVGYIQPPIEICLEVFNPLVLKLAKRQRNRWKYLDEEDYAQICRLVMIRLHKKGYYLHRRLIERALNNEVLMTFRHERNAPPIASFEDTFFTPLSASSEKLLVADVVEDTSLQEERERERVREAELAIFEEVKDIVIDLIGQRQWNELVRDYTNGHTTNWSRKKMQDIKHHFERLGLTRKDFNNKYYG